MTKGKKPSQVIISADQFVKAGIESGNSLMRAYLADGNLENEKEVQFPNIFAKIANLSSADIVLNKSTKDAMEDIFNNLVVEITHPDYAGFYLVGETAIPLGAARKEFKMNDEKLTSDIPIINTAVTVGAKVLSDLYAKYEDALLADSTERAIPVTTRLITTLPVAEYYRSKENKMEFLERYIGLDKATSKVSSFEIIYYVGNKKYHVDVLFEKVLIIEEAVASQYALSHLEMDNEEDARLVSKFMEKYGISEEEIADFFSENGAIHTDIGSGTTDIVPIYEDEPVKHVLGKTLNALNGVGTYYAIHNSINEIVDLVGYTLEVSDVNNILIQHTKNSKRQALKDKIKEIVKEELASYVPRIRESIITQSNELNRANKAPEVLVAYGGGSVILGEELEHNLEEVAEQRDIDYVFMVPEEFATTMNFRGIKNIFRFDMDHYEVQREKLGDDAKKGAFFINRLMKCYDITEAEAWNMGDTDGEEE